MARTLETARLTLRPIRRHEGDELLRIFRDPEVRRYLLDDEVVGVEWMEQEMDRSEDLFDRLGCGIWSIRRRGSEAIVGFAGFRHFFEPPGLQLLYGLLPEHWGRGLATEAAAAVVRHAFERLGFERVIAAADAPNEASVRVMERLGMEPFRENEAGGAGTVRYAVDRAGWSRGAA